jgi:hypothetical protein
MPPPSGAATSPHDGDRPDKMSVTGSNLDPGLRPLARALIELALQLADEQQQDDEGNEEKTA